MNINGKKEEFAEIYKKEVDVIFRYTFLRVSSKEEALDIVQEIFMKFWQAFSGGTPIEHVRSFIFTIARNKIIDWYRKKKPQSLEAMAESEEGVIFEVPDEKVYEDIKISAEVSIVMKTINKLTPQYREVIYLRFVEDLSPTEIAQMLSMTPNAVSVRISRGIEELRNILKISIE